MTAGVPETIIIKHDDHHAEYVGRTAATLPKEEWNSLVALINQANFWEMPVTIKELIPNDGATWTFEGKKDKNQHFIFRVTPKEKESNLFRSMFNLTGIETEFDKYL